MKYIYTFSFFFLFACTYPDIDSVPKFKILQIRSDEYIDLCKFSNLDDRPKYLECLSSYIDTNPDFTKLDLSEKESIELCKIINTDNIELISCLVSIYQVQDY